ncbi:MAG: hypothetical protein S4CHLAM81_12840 [Chlamydiales bacterium]|nr:hypothetical protein [Chlamydiales bacterium]MCH9636059.1 hypothetical protein [Chlamydiales bacterium]MCH9703991.1 hypothetical protein [Chlamydiota bacterium]
MRFSFLLLLFLEGVLLAKSLPPNILDVGPEVYYLRRQRAGGTKQTARMDGIFVDYDRLHRYSWYFGGSYSYAQGRLKGHSGSQSDILSTLTDKLWELRFGYNFQRRGESGYFVAPYGGYGRFDEVNDFHPPTPLLFKFHNSFNFVSVGFLSGVNLSPLFSMWINFKMKFMLNGETKVTDDPVMGDSTLLMNNEVLARIEVPLIFSPPSVRMGLEFVMEPFYEFRHYGGREGFPFDYIDTKYNLYGANFALRKRY